MTRIAAAEAKNRFSELIDRAKNGEEIEVTKYGHVHARIVAPKEERDVEKARAAMTRLRERAKRMKIKFDWEEWKAYRDEGRR